MSAGWRRTASIAAYISAAAAIAAAVAGGIVEPTGIATVLQVVATTIAFAIAPLALSLALWRLGPGGWWTAGAALLATLAWSGAALLFLFGLPESLVPVSSFIAIFVNSAPGWTGLWLVLASADVVRGGLRPWTHVAIGVFVALLIVSTVVIEFSGIDVRKILIPIGWSAWMVDIARRLGETAAPSITTSLPPRAPETCGNCGAPARTDGLAFCAECGLPYGAQRPSP
ncbi:MAG TPA: hypothetical protein VGQ77_13450 [Methylomirabilota bacterium]|nr:hypothetical protein [Methylomirabilota bacterium]